MATYVSLIRFTEQGAKNIRDTQGRANAFREAAQQAGVTVREVYWTLGAYDGLLVFDAPDEQAATAVMVDLGVLGNVRTQTMRAFDESEIGQVLGRTGSGAASGSASSATSGSRSGGKSSKGNGRGRRER
jgi:uncharacterized protein with GYD domain